jgi:predicted permease
LSGIRQDIRFAIRSLRRSPGFTISVLSVLALAIGGTTAVFSVLNGILLRPLPYAEPDRLGIAWTVNTRQDLPDGTSQWNARDWLERSQTLEDLTLYARPDFTTGTVTNFGAPERVHIGLVTENFFRVLGVDPILGRTFSPDDLAGDMRLVVLNESYWHQKFAGSPDALGSTIDVFGDPRRVVGVVPSDVRIPTAETMIWALTDPYAAEPGPTSRRGDAFVVLARLREGGTIAQAQTELSSIASQLGEEYPETNRDLGVRIRPLLSEITGERLPFVLWSIFGAALLVLLVAATNVAHLMLARGARRNRELAIRTALGASRARVVRQLFVEMGVLGAIATVSGMTLGAIVMQLFVGLLPAEMPRLDQVRLDGLVLTIAIAMTLLVAPLFALLPSIAVSRQDPADVLRTGGRGVSARHRVLRRLLVTGEVAMAVLLLAHAGLLVRSVQAVLNNDPGFDAESVVIAQVDLERDSYPTRTDIASFIGSVTSRIKALQYVEGVGVITDFFIRRFPDVRITVSGAQPLDQGDLPRLTGDLVYPGFFAALGIPILAGRDFNETDVSPDGDIRSVVINRSAAEAFWPGRSPIGERLWWSDQPRDLPGIEVIGVVGDIRRGALEDESYPNLFMPGVTWNMDLAIRTAGDPIQIAAAVRNTVREVDQDVPVSRVATARDRFGESMTERRVQSWLLGAFSALALLMAAIGLSGLLDDAVVARRREIGIRIALGATPSKVRGLILREGVVLVGTGLMMGLAGAVAISRITRTFLYGIAPWDPATLVIVILGLLSVAMIASWLPAQRATKRGNVQL